MELTYEQALHMYSYDPETGSIVWKNTHTNNVKPGQEVGHDASNGYRNIKYMGRYYGAHRVAWLLSYGEWPEGYIDHINGVRNDNRLANLRDTTFQGNMQNRHGPHSQNKSGFRGVRWSAHHKKWRADIKVDGKTKYIGHYETPERAHAAYLEAKAYMHRFMPS